MTVWGEKRSADGPTLQRQGLASAWEVTGPTGSQCGIVVECALGIHMELAQVVFQPLVNMGF